MSILYPYIPAMPLCDNCGECCGPVTVTEQEYGAIATFINERSIAWEAKADLECGFLDAKAKRCRIYPVRPFACRLFGVAHEMACPHHPSATVLSFPAGRAMTERWMTPADLLLGEAVALVTVSAP